MGFGGAAEGGVVSLLRHAFGHFLLVPAILTLACGVLVVGFALLIARLAGEFLND